MTDRHAGYIVTLEEDIRADDAQNTIRALSMVRGVASVEPVVSDVAVQIAEARASTKFLRKLLDFAGELQRNER